MSDNWDFYITRINDTPASVFVDLGLAAEAPKEDYRVRLMVRLILKEPAHNGMTTRDEADALWLLEDALVPAVSDWGAIFAGRVTTEGRRDFFFYAPSPDGFDVIVSAALLPVGYEFDTHDTEDPGWQFYFEILYPSPADWQAIMNRRVLENLKRGGDDLSKSRGIFHWLYFITESDRDRCADAARAKGFLATLGPTKTKPDAKYAHGLELYRVNPVTPAEIDDVCLELVEMANQFGGEYDGWETQIVKPGEEPADDTPKW